MLKVEAYHLNKQYYSRTTVGNDLSCCCCYCLIVSNHEECAAFGVHMVCSHLRVCLSVSFQELEADYIVYFVDVCVGSTRVASLATAFIGGCIMSESIAAGCFDGFGGNEFNY